MLCLDCIREINNTYVVVHASAYTYNAIGTFTCSNGGDIFQQNGDLFESKTTTCQASANWENEDIIYCWSGNAF